eukprot:Hpha_TRINITY_DN16738_c0_g7::TRINITY_DN16738_c0_g7_i1::g.79430::m.79430
MGSKSPRNNAPASAAWSAGVLRFHCDRSSACRSAVQALKSRRKAGHFRSTSEMGNRNSPSVAGGGPRTGCTEAAEADGGGGESSRAGGAVPRRSSRRRDCSASCSCRFATWSVEALCASSRAARKSVTISDLSLSSLRTSCRRRASSPGGGLDDCASGIELPSGTETPPKLMWSAAATGVTAPGGRSMSEPDRSGLAPTTSGLGGSSITCSRSDGGCCARKWPTAMLASATPCGGGSSASRRVGGVRRGGGGGLGLLPPTAGGWAMRRSCCSFCTSPARIAVTCCRSLDRSAARPREGDFGGIWQSPCPGDNKVQK